MKENKVPFLRTTVTIYTDRSLEDLASVLSETLFMALPFGGKEEYIYEEVPAIFLASRFLGMKVILSGYGKEDGYGLEVSSDLQGNHGWPYVLVDFDDYLELCVRNALKDYPDIKVQFRRA
jgi:hypothetical protein